MYGHTSASFAVSWRQLSAFMLDHRRRLKAVQADAQHRQQEISTLFNHVVVKIDDDCWGVMCNT
jgi:myo-inositol catabolism protein IolC